MDHLNQDETLLARWLAGDLQEGDLEALRNLEGFPEYVEMLEALEGMELPDFSPTLSWQAMKEKLSAAKAEPDQLKQDPQQAVIDTGLANDPAPILPAIEENIPAKTETEPSLTTDKPTVQHHEIPTTGQQSAVVRRLFPWKSVMGIAAAIGLLIVSIWWVTTKGFAGEPMAETKAGEQKEVKLPDGSTVILNAMSELSYSAEEWSAGRKVTLAGEGYFKAKKGKIFTVETEQGSVEVVGTMFNVFARGEEMEVKCTEGKVQVLNPDASERVLIKAGEQVTVQNGRMKQRQGLAFQPKWFKGESTFRSAPLEKVFDELERQFGVVVVADSLEGRNFSGKFVHKDLGQALKMVCVPMKLKYAVTNDTVRIQ